MTKRQAGVSARLGLSFADVLAAAFTVLDRDGLSRLSTRAIASELAVSMNTVIWHIGSKDRLLEHMADQIVGRIALNTITGTPRQRVIETMSRLRRAMLHHRDGALVISGTFPVMPATLAFSDHLLAALAELYPTTRTAAWTAWSLFYFTLGLVQEEQRAPASFLHQQLENSVTASQYPALAEGLDDFVSPHYEARFDFGIQQLLRT